MKKQGEIKLIYWDGSVMSKRLYRHPLQRKEIIDRWRIIYWNKFVLCAIHITPDTTEEEVISKRHKAEYNNIPVYNYNARGKRGL